MSYWFGPNVRANFQRPTRFQATNSAKLAISQATTPTSKTFRRYARANWFVPQIHNATKARQLDNWLPALLAAQLWLQASLEVYDGVHLRQIEPAGLHSNSCPRGCRTVCSSHSAHLVESSAAEGISWSLAKASATTAGSKSYKMNWPRGTASSVASRYLSVSIDTSTIPNDCPLLFTKTSSGKYKSEKGFFPAVYLPPRMC